jgi:ABC-type xylose transport system permease subunit
MRLAALAAPEARGSLTENGNVVGAITVEGTIALMLFAGVGSAIVGTAAYIVLRPWLPRRTTRGGLVFGGFLLALLGGRVVDPGNADFTILGDGVLNVSVFSMLFVAFGLVATAAIVALEERVPPAATLTPRMWGLTLLCTLPVVPGFAGLVTGFATERGLLLVGAWAGMHVAAALDRRRRDRVARLARALATATALLVVGLTGAEFVAGADLIL